MVEWQEQCIFILINYQKMECYKNLDQVIVELQNMKCKEKYMKLTKELALQMIEEYRGKTKSDRWIDHCICVGDTAGKIAKALTEKGYNVDIDKTITLGYLHDIGKYTGESHGHEISGYNYLKDKGYDEEYCNICITHSYLNKLLF